jgi:preprotein translocase subunit SecG
MLLNILLTLLIIVAVALTGIILMQRSEGGALGMGGGGQFMSVRGASDLLTRTTQVLGALFFILSLSITVLTGRIADGGSVVDRVKIEGIDPNQLNQPPAGAPAQPGGFAAPLPTTGAPAAPAADLSTGFGAAPLNPAAPAAPAAPPAQ